MKAGTSRLTCDAVVDDMTILLPASHAKSASRGPVKIAALLPTLLKIPAIRTQMLGASGHAGAAAGREHVSHVHVEGGRGSHRIMGRLEDGDGYLMAAELAVLAVEAICCGKPPIGAHTLATAFGPDFIRSASVVRITLEHIC